MSEPPTPNQGAETIRLPNIQVRERPDTEEPLPNPLRLSPGGPPSAPPADEPPAAPIARPTGPGPGDFDPAYQDLAYQDPTYRDRAYRDRPHGRARHRSVGGLVLPAFFSIGWIALCIAYFHYFFGWEALALLLPHEIMAYVVGAMVPLSLLWLATSYRRRGISMERTMRGLERRLSDLTYPADGAEASVRNVTEALQRQADMLSGASHEAIAQAKTIEDTLKAHCRDLGQADRRSTGHGTMVG